MAADEPCPECRGTEYRLVSPGLHACEHVIHWTEREQITEYLTEDDPGAFYDYGLRGTRTLPVTRWVDVEHSRACNHVYEVDTPMSATPCQLGRDGRACGAFAVGHCSDCARPVCRHHGTFFDGRLLCDACKEAIDSRSRHAAAESRAAADRVEKERRALAAEQVERVRAADAAEQVAYDNLPVMSTADWVRFLESDDEFAATDHPVWNGRRPTTLTLPEAAALFAAARFPTRRVRTGMKSLLGRPVATKERGWVVGQETGVRTERGENVKYTYWVVVLESGRKFGCVEYKGDLSTAGAGSSRWRPTAAGLASARAFLRG